MRFLVLFKTVGKTATSGTHIWTAALVIRGAKEKHCIARMLQKNRAGCTFPIIFLWSFWMFFLQVAIFTSLPGARWQHIWHHSVPPGISLASHLINFCHSQGKPKMREREQIKIIHIIYASAILSKSIYYMAHVKIQNLCLNLQFYSMQTSEYKR